MSADGLDPRGAGLREITLTLCDLCIEGKGGECHVPGCALYMNRAPDVPLSAAAGPDAPGAEQAERLREALREVVDSDSAAHSRVVAATALRSPQPDAERREPRS